MPSLAGPVSAPPSPFGALADPSAAQPDMQAQMTGLLGQLRDIASQVTALIQANPALAQEGQQMTDLIRQMIVKSAQTASRELMCFFDTITGAFDGT